MFNKVEYWLELCDDDMKVAKNLLKSKDYLWMAFLCHLIVEKSIKAVIAHRTEQEPKRLHDLAKLAEQAILLNELVMLKWISWRNSRHLISKHGIRHIRKKWLPNYQSNIATV